jgi:hypothetical protein
MTMPVHDVLLHQLNVALATILTNLQSSADNPAGEPLVPESALRQAHAALEACQGYSRPPVHDPARPRPPRDLQHQLHELRAGLGALMPWVADKVGPGEMWPRLFLEAVFDLPLVANGPGLAEREPASVRFTATDVQTLRPDWDDATAKAWLARKAKTIEERMTETGWQVIEHLLDAEPASVPPMADSTPA